MTYVCTKVQLYFGNFPQTQFNFLASKFQIFPLYHDHRLPLPNLITAPGCIAYYAPLSRGVLMVSPKE